MYATFRIFKDLLRAAPAATSGPPPTVALNAHAQRLEDNSAASVENKKLRLQLQQRDNEIAILTSLLRKQQPALASASAEASAAAHPTARTPDADGGARSSAAGAAEPNDSRDALLCLDSLQDRAKAFEMFRRSYRKNAAIESNRAVRSVLAPGAVTMPEADISGKRQRRPAGARKAGTRSPAATAHIQELKAKYGEAKALAARATALKHDMSALKQRMEHARLQSAAADIVAGGAGASSRGADDDADRARLAAQRQDYTHAFERLRDLKVDIEHLHGMMQASAKQLTVRIPLAVTHGERGAEPWPSADAAGDPQAWSWRVQRDFEQWWRSSGAAHLPGATSSDSASAQTASDPVARPAADDRRPGRALTVPPAADVPASVLKAAGPHLTGDARADEDIVAFFLARHKVLAVHAT